MANEAEVSSALVEISAAPTGYAINSSSIVEISAAIPDGAAAIASAIIEISYSFPIPVIPVIPEIPPELIPITESFVLKTEIHVQLRKRSYSEHTVGVDNARLDLG